MKETLLTAARRAHRDFNIDMNNGGLVTRDTERSFLTLGKMIEAADDEMKIRGRVLILKEEAEVATKSNA